MNFNDEVMLRSMLGVEEGGELPRDVQEEYRRLRGFCDGSGYGGAIGAPALAVMLRMLRYKPSFLQPVGQKRDWSEVPIGTPVYVDYDYLRKNGKYRGQVENGLLSIEIDKTGEVEEHPQKNVFIRLDGKHGRVDMESGGKDLKKAESVSVKDGD